MPTDMRRLQIALPPDVDDALVRLHRISGKPQATIVRELLSDMVPVVLELAEAMEHATASPRESFAKLQKVLDQATVEARQAQLDLDAARKRKPGRKPKSGRPPG